MSVPMIAGLYPYVRNGVTHPPKDTLAEIPISLEINPFYRDNLMILAGNRDSAHCLESFGLAVHRIFDDAPAHVRLDMAHKMKHWMCLWALREFGEFLWVDWDTVMLQSPPDDDFWASCRHGSTPKFIRIPEYWATVNCGVYYACEEWLTAMEDSFNVTVTKPNDELLWTGVLPADVRERPEFWWGELAVNIWDESDFAQITNKTVFAHVRELAWATQLRERQRKMRPGDADLTVGYF